MNYTLLALSLLPVIVLMVFIYRQDKFQKESVKSLLKAFFGGILAIPIDLIMVSILNAVFESDTYFYSAFFEAGLCEELSKLLIFMIFIWPDKNFDEYMDGIVYATFIGLGFACVENVMYVFGAADESFDLGISTGIMRALLSVPGHFLFGVVLGYFLSLAKFGKHVFGNVLVGLLLAVICHGLFDWLLMVGSDIGDGIGALLFVAFLVGDVYLWKLGMKYIRRQQDNSRLQAETEQSQCDNPFDGSISDGQESGYKDIDWNAGFKS